MLFGLLGGKKGSSKPTVKQIVTRLKLPNKSVMWKEAEKELKRVLPYITEHELVEVHSHFKEGGKVRIRLSKKEADLFKVLDTSDHTRRDLVPREQYSCCGRGIVCGLSCAMDVQSSLYMGPTDLGIVPVAVEGGGGDCDGDFAEQAAASLTEVEEF